MKIKSITLTIDNYDNACMEENPEGETINILEKLINKIKMETLEDFDYFSPRDTNGNKVGEFYIEVEDEDS